MIDAAPQNQKKIALLPPQYTDVQPVMLTNNDMYVPASNVQLITGNNPHNAAYTKEVEWLQQAEDMRGKEKLDQSDVISWAAFHASKIQSTNYEHANISLLPLFEEYADSAAMIMHAINVIKSAINHLNPGQVPVIALDQPLFAIRKQIKWNWPDSHGEDHFILMFGGLHI